MEILGYLQGAVTYEDSSLESHTSENVPIRHGNYSPDEAWGKSGGRSLSTLAMLPVDSEFSADFAGGTGKVSLQMLTVLCSLSILLGPATPAAATAGMGSRGTDVTQLQQALTAAGFYDGPVTGYYGELTQTAVKHFQKANGLVVDGVAGPNTLAALQRAVPGSQLIPQNYPGTPTSGFEGLTLGAIGPSVSSLQTQLTRAGFYQGPIDSYFGPQTQAALVEFQRFNGLNPTGVVDSPTLTMLQRYGGVFPVSTQTAIAQPAGGSSAQVIPPSAVRPGSPLVPQPGIQPTFQPTSSTATLGTGATFSSGGNLPDQTLYRGDRGPQVSQLQEVLSRAGVYQGPVTGYYGALTEAAVLRFQRLNGIEPTGVYGPITFEVLSSTTDLI